MYKMTKHAQVDRYDRICTIIDHFGIGEPQYSCLAPEGNRRYVLTTTGVFLVVGLDDVLITAYMCSINSAIYIFRTALAHGAIPHAYYKILQANEKKIKQHPEWGLTLSP